MARPQKQGLSYYSCDTDIFQNRKIKRLIKRKGGDGYLIYTFLLTEIYRDKGFYIAWDGDVAFDTAYTLHLEVEDINSTVEFCIEVGLFDKEQFQSNSILTSEGIQNRWQAYSSASNRVHSKVSDVAPNYATGFKEEFDETLGKLEETQDKSEETQEKSEETQESGQETTRREKKRKEEKRREVRASSASRFSPPAPQQVKEYCVEKGIDVDEEAFVDFYESKGWKVGNAPMKDWKAAVRNWQRRDNERKTEQPKPRTRQEQITEMELDPNRYWK